MKAYEKDWDTACLFLTSDLHRVLALDSTLASHPIVVGVDTPDQINSVFDTISYSKGASVIRMLETFMGPEDFRKGIHNFLVFSFFLLAFSSSLKRGLPLFLGIFIKLSYPKIVVNISFSCSGGLAPVKLCFTSPQDITST